MSPQDIRWDGEDPIVPPRGERGFQKSMARGGAVAGAGRGRGTTKGQLNKDLCTLRNETGRKAALGDIEILHTDILIKEVWFPFGDFPFLQHIMCCFLTSPNVNFYFYRWRKL